VAWLTITRGDGLRTTLAVVRQPGLRPALVVMRIPVASFEDCLDAARRAAAARNTAENLARLEALLMARAEAQRAALAAQAAMAEASASEGEPRQGPAIRAVQATAVPAAAPLLWDRDLRERAHSLREELIDLARVLAAADLLGLGCARLAGPQRRRVQPRHAQCGTTQYVSCCQALRGRCGGHPRPRPGARADAGADSIGAAGPPTAVPAHDGSRPDLIRPPVRRGLNGRIGSNWPRSFPREWPHRVADQAERLTFLDPLSQLASSDLLIVSE
jgi:hypothetical protein